MWNKFPFGKEPSSCQSSLIVRFTILEVQIRIGAEVGLSTLIQYGEVGCNRLWLLLREAPPRSLQRGWHCPIEASDIFASVLIWRRRKKQFGNFPFTRSPLACYMWLELTSQGAPVLHLVWSHVVLQRAREEELHTRVHDARRATPWEKWRSRHPSSMFLCTMLDSTPSTSKRHESQLILLLLTCAETSGSSGPYRAHGVL